MVKIGTHDGCFHCDEVLACYLLKQLPEYANAIIVRSRNEDVLSGCDVVVDVGGVYDVKKLRFDHHQADFTCRWCDIHGGRKGVIKLSSAGLIYAQFGKQILSILTKRKISDEAIDRMFSKIYFSFIVEVDAIDNGVDPASQCLYQISTGLSSRVSALNVWWNRSEPSEEVLFQKALKLVGDEFQEAVTYQNESWWPCRELVLESHNNRFVNGYGGRILLLRSSCPWRSHLKEIEFDLNKPRDNVLLVIHPKENKWFILAVRQTQFSYKVLFPASWRGFADEALDQKTGIKDCLFVHSSGHMAIHKTQEGALKLAQLCLN